MGRDEQPKCCYHSVIDHKQKNSFFIGGEKNDMTKCKALNICLLKIFWVLNHNTPLSEKN